jgi:putative multiple sugar transport system ATP-binding protein
MSVAENIFLGAERRRGPWVDWDRANADAATLLAKYRIELDPDTPVRELGVGQKQLVEIVKALGKQSRILILDEPTAALAESEVAILLRILRELRASGVACIYISHKLGEVKSIADRITVLRDGASITTLDCSQGPADEDQIIRAMVGRTMADRYPQRQPQIGELLFELRDWRVHHPQHADRLVVKGVNLQVRRGEIVGIAGLMGAGRTELAMSVFGRSWGQRISGTALMNGQPVDLSTVGKAVQAGLAYVTEDRKSLGLVLGQSIRFNTTLAHLDGVAPHGVIDDAREWQVAHDFRQRLATRCTGVEQSVVHLSGGNQQKVVLAKWLFAGPSLLILDEPTRGIDVGAKYEIYTLMAQLAAEGRSILVISSEMPELLGLCDRLYVMNEGAFVAEMAAADASQEKIMRAIVGAGA